MPYSASSQGIFPFARRRTGDDARVTTRTGRALNRARGRWIARRVDGGEGLLAESGVRVVRLGPGTVRVGPGVLLAHHVALHLRDAGAVIEIGAGTFVNHRSEIVAHERVTIGTDCLVAGTC
jgi:acetyltransferase-like isoleucine patch superfamily enzyme